MKCYIRDLGSFFFPLVFILSGCSDSNLKLRNLSAQSLMESPDLQSDSFSAYLTSEEAALAQDKSNISIETKLDMNPTSFNLQEWPLSCLSNQENDAAECADKDSKSVGLRQLRISGHVIIIDSNDITWAGINNRKSIRSLVIEADKIVIRSKLAVPSADLTLIATEIIIEPLGVLDVTPVSSAGVSAPFGHDLKNRPMQGDSGKAIAYNGKDGIPGSTIRISSNNLNILGDPSTQRFIAKGGGGEAAGQGFGQTIEDFKSNPLRAQSVTAIGDIPGALPKYSKSVVFSQGHIHSYELGFEGRRESFQEKYVPIRQNPLGQDKWPDNGMDAMPGGYPGSGGNGGAIYFHITNGVHESWERFADVGVGPDGKSDGVRKGSLAGTPNPAYKASAWTKPAYLAIAQPIFEENFQKDGADAIGPSAPKKHGVVGRIMQDSDGTFFGFSKNYFDLKVKRIRSLYISRRYTEMVQLVNLAYDSLSKSKGSDLSLIKIQLGRIANSLSNQKDYFGRGLADVPNYTFNFNAIQFETRVERAMRAYELANAFEKYHSDIEKRNEVIRNTLTLLDQGFADSVQSLKESYKLISDIETESVQVQKNQKSIELELESIRKQIEVRAKENVESRKRIAEFNRFLDVAATVCQVIPVGQPALGMAATLAKTALKGPNSQTLSGYVDLYKSLKSQIKENEQNADLKTSREQWGQFKDQFDYEHLRGKSIEEKGRYLGDLYEKLSPTIDKISDALTPLNQPIFGADEIQNEIAKIQTQDPVFQPIFSDITNKLQNLLERKMNIQKDLQTFGLIVERISMDLNNYVLISEKTSDLAINASADDGVLAQVYRNISDDSQEKLLEIYSEVVGAYEYTVLEEFTVKFSLADLRGKMDGILSEAKPGQASVELKSFYFSQLEQLKNKIAEKNENLNRLTYTVSRGVDRVLSDLELSVLNRDGCLDIELTKDLYDQAENVRIIEVGLKDSGYSFVKNRSGPNKINGEQIGLRFELAKNGSLFYEGKLHTFNYPMAHEGMFRWDKYFQFLPGSDTPNVEHVERSATTDGLFDIANGSSGKLLLVNHAGLTSLRVRRLSYAASRYSFKKLILTINFEYSSQKN